MENDEKELVSALERAPFHEDTKVCPEYAREYMKLLIDCYKQKVTTKCKHSTLHTWYLFYSFNYSIIWLYAVWAFLKCWSHFTPIYTGGQTLHEPLRCIPHQEEPQGIYQPEEQVFWLESPSSSWEFPIPDSGWSRGKNPICFTKANLKNIYLETSGYAQWWTGCRRNS